MKKLFLAFATLCAVAMQSCESGATESDKGPDVSQGGDDDTTTAGAPILIDVKPGKSRAQISWLINGNEKDVKYSYVYYTDEERKESNTPCFAGKSADTITQYVANIPEGVLSFKIKNYYESTGEYSEASESISVDIYGDEYVSSLAPCPVTPNYTAAEGGTLTWGEADDYLGSNVYYTDNTGAKITKFSSKEEKVTTLENILGGAEVTYESFYLPSEEAIDTLSIAPAKVVIPTDINEVIEVPDLASLVPYAKMSNVNVKVAPGTYNITAADMSTNKYPGSTLILGNHRRAILLFEGDNSIYDLTGVTVTIEKEVWTELNSTYRELVFLQVTGSENHIIGVKQVDIGGQYDFPNRGYTNVIIDGYKNCMEGIEIQSLGSFPYLYGEVFGKAGEPTITHRKHCAFLVRGTENHILDCIVKHYAFGHCMFMQAAYKPKIEGCYVTSEVNSTRNILLEKGTGSPADEVNFETPFGYNVEAIDGYTFACSEEGIRAYGSGQTVVKGVEYDRGTSEATILNCTIVTARAGVTLTHSTGVNYVEGCTTIGCERGYAINTNGIIKNCYSDTQYGPALGVDYTTNSNITAEITLLANGKGFTNNDGTYSGNGSTHAAIIIGSGHHITFHNDPDVDHPYYDPLQELYIHVGGDNKTIGEMLEVDNYYAKDITIDNKSGFKIILDDQASNCKITTSGEVENNGTNNSIIKR